MRCKPKSRLTPHSKSVLRSERVKGSLRRFAPLTRTPPVDRRQKTAAKEGCPRACAQPECASTQNSILHREPVFFIPRQALVASSKNALAYDGWSSGPIIYTYVGGNPISRVDPMGLLDRLVFDGRTLTGYEDFAVEFRVPAVSGPYGLGKLPEGV